MKFNTETDVQYIVRVMRNNYEEAQRKLDEAKLLAAAAHEAYSLVERAERYLSSLPKTTVGG